MTGEEALQVIARLVAVCGTWDDAAVTVYAEEVERCTSVEAAHAATTAVIEEWDQRGRPPFAIWRKAYQEHLRREHATAGMLPSPPSGPRMRPSEYLLDLQRRARPGMPEWRELEDWQRHGIPAAVGIPVEERAEATAVLHGGESDDVERF